MKDPSMLRQKLHPPALEVEEELDEAALFEKAMAEVKPLDSKKCRAPIKPARKLAKARTANSPLDEMRLEFVSAVDDLEALFESESVVGGDAKWDRRLIEKLRNGGFSVQGELDLHGLGQQEAFRELEAFILRCTSRRLTCVRVIHGKGKNSPNHIPVLKMRLPHWLEQKRLARHVIAFTTARPVDGGGGALYLLLRRRRNRGK